MANAYGIKANVLSCRLRSNWPLKDALLLPDIRQNKIVVAFKVEDERYYFYKCSFCHEEHIYTATEINIHHHKHTQMR